MSDQDFVNNYLKDLSLLLKPNEELVSKIITVKDILMKTKKK